MRDERRDFVAFLGCEHIYIEREREGERENENRVNVLHQKLLSEPAFGGPPMRRDSKSCGSACKIGLDGNILPTDS